jgi:hypothetical protein
MKPHEFYEVMPDGRYRFRVDHHTINDFNTCDRYFAFRHIPDNTGLVWGSKYLAMKIALGSWWSSVMEMYYREMAFGSLPDDHTVWKIATDAWKEHNMEQYKNAGKDAEVYDKFGGPDGGRLMALEYHNAFGKLHYQTWYVIGPELGFGWRDELKLGEDDLVEVYYGGKPDLTIWDKAQNMIMPLDFKTKDSVPGNSNVMFKPHPQTAGYIFAIQQFIKAIKDSPNAPSTSVLEPTKCVIMVCARFRPTDKPRDGIRKPRFVPVYINYSAAEIEEWRLGIVEKCRRLRDAIHRGIWIPRESACHLFYHGCTFRRVCSSPANVRPMLLAADFSKVEPWTPYDAEED